MLVCSVYSDTMKPLLSQTLIIQNSDYRYCINQLFIVCSYTLIAQQPHWHKVLVKMSIGLERFNMDNVISQYSSLTPLDNRGPDTTNTTTHQINQFVYAYIFMCNTQIGLPSKR